ncbi:MAG TPA: hypothetical protein VKR42_03015 [Ktedonobacteraceae bacterium]|nr:hypothetical protein [Ktedonobacteraceae bacterium]
MANAKMSVIFAFANGITIQDDSCPFLPVNPQAQAAQAISTD